jgi:para-nitrobenzyl esterase
LDETIYIGNPADKQLSDKTMEMWTTFAKTGNPSIESLEWKKYNPSDRAAMILEKEPKLEYDIKKDQRRLLMPLLRDTISASYAHVSFNVPFVKKALLKIALGVGIISGIVCLIIILLNGGAN